MENKFKISKFKKDGDVFIFDGYDEFTITYLKSSKIHMLRIVVNGYLTKQTINLLLYHNSYKNKILLSIKEFLERGTTQNNIVVKKLNLKHAKEIYSNQIIYTIKNRLLTINKETSRDKLTEFGLILT